MAVSVNIPGFGEVQAQNAAQDDTLNRIASILTDIASKQGAKLSAGSVKALDRASKKAAISTRKASDSVENLGHRSGDASSNIYGLSTAAQTMKSAFAQASSSLTSGKETFGSGLDIMAGMIKSGGKLVQEGLEKIPVASIAGGLIGLATGAGAAILAIISQTAKSFQALQQAGGSFGYSLEAVRDQANMAGLRLDQFQNVFAKNSKAFAAFGGSTEQGARDFARLNMAVRDGRKGFGGVGRDLLRMGIGFEEQASGVADSLEQFKLAGMNLQSMANPAAAVGRYQLIQAKQLKVLTQLNGTTMEQEKAKQSKMKDDAALQMILAKTSGDQRIALQRAYAEAESLMPGAGRLMLEMFESGGPMTEASGMFLMANKEIGRVVAQTAAGVKSGMIGSEIAGEQMARNLNNAAMNANRLENAQNLGAAVLAGQGGPFAEVVKNTFVQGQKLEQALGNVTEIFEDLDKLSKPAVGMTKTVLDTLEAQQKITTQISTIMTSIAGGPLAREFVLDPVSAGAEWLTELAKAGTEVTKGWREGLMPASADLTTIFNDLFPDWLLGIVRGMAPAAKPKGEALGGPIDAGGSYIVGERGPELITPGLSGFVTPSNKLFALMQDSVTTAMDDMIASTQGSAMSAGTDMQAEMDKISAISGQGGTAMAETTDVSRKREVEDAMLALPGLLMDNTDAVNKANVDTTDILDVFYRALA